MKKNRIKASDLKVGSFYYLDSSGNCFGEYVGNDGLFYLFRPIINEDYAVDQHGLVNFSMRYNFSFLPFTVEPSLISYTVCTQEYTVPMEVILGETCLKEKQIYLILN